MLWLINFKYTFKNLLKHKILYFFVLVYITLFLVFVVILPISSQNEILSSWSVVENNNISFIMVISSGVSGILIGFIFKETQDNNLDLIISTKTLSKWSCVSCKLLVFLITEVFIALLVIMTIACFIPLLKVVTLSHIFYLFVNIIIIHLIFVLLYGGFALIIANIGSKVLTVLSPIVFSMTVTIYSTAVDFSHLRPTQQMMANDNIQATTIKYFAGHNGRTTRTEIGAYFTSYNPDIQFSNIMQLRNYYATVQSQYTKFDLYGNPIRQFALMSNSIGLVDWTEKYMSNAFGGTKMANYAVKNLIYLYQDRPPLMFVVSTQSADYNVWLMGNSGTTEKLLSDNIGYLYNGEAVLQNMDEFDNYQLMPNNTELTSFDQLYNDFNDNIITDDIGAYWNGYWNSTPVNEYEWLRHYFKDNTHPFQVKNDYELNYRILQFKTFQWYQGCIDFRNLAINGGLSNLTAFFHTPAYFKLQWQLQTFAMSKLNHGVKWDESGDLFFDGTEYSMGFNLIKLSLLQNVVSGFVDFTANPQTDEYWIFDILWSIVGASLLSIGIILYYNKDFA